MHLSYVIARRAVQTTLLPRALLGALLCGMLAACSMVPVRGELSERQINARAMWQERCKQSGEFIHKTVDDVEGLVLLKLRNWNANFEDQFLMEDLYGSDVGGTGYIKSFLRGYLLSGRTDYGAGYDAMGKRGYLYVEAVDPDDGKRYRYTGRLDEPWQADKSYLKGYIHLLMDRVPAPPAMPRYGVTFEDISTRLDRENWIAGSSLKVIDLKTNEVIAERIGYMYDWAQGSREGFRSPWLMAADNACPAFGRSDVKATTAQIGQTVRFVEKVLHPTK